MKNKFALLAAAATGAVAGFLLRSPELPPATVAGPVTTATPASSLTEPVPAPFEPVATPITNPQAASATAAPLAGVPASSGQLAPPTAAPSVSAAPQQVLPPPSAQNYVGATAARPQSPVPENGLVPKVFQVAGMAQPFVLPPGAVLPASLTDAGEGATQAQVDALDRIAEDFLNQVSTEGGDEANRQVSHGKPPGQSVIWNAANREANERYRQLFGVEAYNAWTAAAAQQALQERKNAAGR